MLYTKIKSVNSNFAGDMHSTLWLYRWVFITRMMGSVRLWRITDRECFTNKWPQLRMERFSQARFSLQVRLVNDQMIGSNSFHFSERQKATEIYLKILKLQISTPTCLATLHLTWPLQKYHPKIPRSSQIPRLVSSTCLLGYWSPWDEVGGAGWCPGSQDRSRSRFRGFFPSKKRLLPMGSPEKKTSCLVQDGPRKKL